MTGTESVVRRNAIANFAGSGWSALMTILFIPIYVGAVGIEGYAIIALQPVLHAWLSFLDAALAPALSARSPVIVRAQQMHRQRSRC